MGLSDTQVDVPILELQERRIIKLPTEVEEYIISLLENDYWTTETIAACARVCRAWLPYSRFKLYYIIELRHRQQWVPLENLLSGFVLSNVVEYLEGVRELHVDVWEKTAWKERQQRPWVHLVLIQCALRLTGLTCIKLWQVDFGQCHLTTLRCGIYYRSLTTLQLRWCKFSSVRQLHIFVTAFPALSDLSLGEIRFRVATIPLSIPKGGHPLTRLALRDMDHDLSHDESTATPTVSSWLVNAQLVDVLTYFQWHVRHPAVVRSWKGFMETIHGSSLQELDISAPFKEGLYSLCCTL